jgi:hypothetical protein
MALQNGKAAKLGYIHPPYTSYMFRAVDDIGWSGDRRNPVRFLQPEWLQIKELRRVASKDTFLDSGDQRNDGVTVDG